MHCPTLAGSNYRTIRVAADSTVVEVLATFLLSHPVLPDNLTQIIKHNLQVVNLLGVEGSLVERRANKERWLDSTEKPLEVVSGDMFTECTRKWVSFPRTGKMSVFCHFFLKVKLQCCQTKRI